MQRCAPKHADLILDTWGWRLTRFTEAQDVRHKLAGYKGAHWPDGPGPVRRLTAVRAETWQGPGTPPGEEA